MVDLTLGLLGVIFLLVVMIFRIIMVGISLRKFAKMFADRREMKEGIKLLRYLEIPGLEKFVKQEIILTIVPYTTLLLVILLTPVADVNISDINLILLILTVISLSIWAMVDFIRSYMINGRLEAVRKETSALRKISGNLLDGLKYVVYLRGSVAKSAVSLGKRALVGLAKKKVKDSTKETKKKPFGIAALIALERLVSFPERIIGKITNWGKEAIDEKLKDKFEKYSHRTKFQISLYVIWSVLPSIILLFVATITNLP